MRMLTHPPACFSVLSGPGLGDTNCGTQRGNVETGLGDDKVDNGNKFYMPAASRPTKDYSRGDLGKCALVGNAPFLKQAKSGRAIDRHKTVWRFNLKAGRLLRTSARPTLNLLLFLLLLLLLLLILLRASL